MSLNANDTSVNSARLTSIRDRQVCCVEDFHLSHDDEARLKNMGICIGRRIEVLQIGDPLIVKVSGANVGIARRLAIGIEVRLDASIGDETSRWSTDDLTKNEDRPLQATSVA